MLVPCVFVQRCSIPGCLLPRCDIPGTQYCTGHHALKYSEPPTLDDFLKNTEHTRLLQEFMLEARKDEKHLLEFCLKAQAYKSISSRATRKHRAKPLYEQFVLPTGEHSVGLTEGCVAEITASLDSGRISLFNDARVGTECRASPAESHLRVVLLYFTCVGLLNRRRY